MKVSKETLRAYLFPLRLTFPSPSRCVHCLASYLAPLEGIGRQIPEHPQWTRWSSLAFDHHPTLLGQPIRAEAELEPNCMRIGYSVPLQPYPHLPTGVPTASIVSTHVMVIYIVFCAAPLSSWFHSHPLALLLGSLKTSCLQLSMFLSPAPSPGSLKLCIRGIFSRRLKLSSVIQVAVRK